MPDPLSFRWPGEFIDRVDHARGLAKRTAFVKECVEFILEGGDEFVNAILRRIPETRGATQRPLTTQEALRLVQERHRARRASLAASEEA